MGTDLFAFLYTDCLHESERKINMTYYTLPLTEGERQVLTLEIAPDGIALQARVEVRYLPAPDLWVISIWDNSSGVLLINQIPLICSYGEINDLLLPFRHLRKGKALGSLFCIRAVDEPSTPDPAEGNLTQFQVLWGDMFDAGSLEDSTVISL